MEETDMKKYGTIGAACLAVALAAASPALAFGGGHVRPSYALFGEVKPLPCHTTFRWRAREQHHHRHVAGRDG